MRDVTQRKHLEKELRMSEERFRSLVDGLQVGVVVHGLNTEILLCNKAALKLLGLTEDQLLGKTSLDPSWNVIHEDGSDFPGETHPSMVALTTGQTARAVMGVYRPATRDRVWLLVHAEPELNPDGSVHTVVVSFSDVTALRAAQERVRRSEQLFSKVFDASPACITISTLDEGRYTHVNQAFLAMSGYNIQEVIGRTAYDLNLWPAPQDRKRVVERLRSEGRIPQFETLCRRKSGEFCSMLLAMELIELNGQPHLLAIGQDITERKEHERQVAELAAKTQAVEALRQYLGHITHDLRNPLAVMTTSLYLMRRKLGATLEDVPQFEVLNRQIENLTQMVDNIAEVFRLEYTLDQLEHRPVDLNEIVSSVVDQQNPAAALNRQTLRAVYRDRLPLIRGDAERLQRMIANLVVNAIQYTPSGGEILVETRVVGGEAVIEVSDNGIGIEPEHLPHIFEHFYRVDDARPTTAGSAGLGLTIAKQIAEKHRGCVEVESEPGQGSVFRVRLPT